jgi:predicted enzyme related to lactoylglutathione lyase
MNELAYFEIQANNPKRAAGFYEKVFGWEFTKDPAIPIDYWRIKAGWQMGGLLRRPAKAPLSHKSGTNAFVCSIMVKDFDETAKKIKSLGGKVALDKFAVPGKCWQGYFIDTEGNTFGIFELDETAK